MFSTLKRLFQTLGAGLFVAGSALAQAPANDNFANAIALPAGLPASATGSNIRATNEAGEGHYYNGSYSVWWSWTATGSNRVQVDTLGSKFDTVLEVFEGTTLSGLTTLAYQKSVTVSARNLVATQPSEAFDLTFYVKIGLFSGHFKNPATGARQSFAGAVMQGQDAAYGFSAARGGVVGPVALIPSEVLGAPSSTSGVDASSGVDFTISSSLAHP